MVPRDVAVRLHRQARAARWNLPVDDFARSLALSAARRFGPEVPPPSEVQRYLESLHLEDLALASACARGLEAAWEHFVRELRPTLLRVAGASAPPDVARELADSLYADLFGLEERDGQRRSLFDYYHGRSTLAGWLRVVLAQRAVDRARAAKRFDPLPEEDVADPGTGTAARDGPPDIDAQRLLPLVRRAFAFALGALAPGDRLRLSLYYVQGVKLLAIGRMFGESEASASRKLERTRRELRAAIARRLEEHDGLSAAQVAACFEHASTDQAFDLSKALPAEADGRR